MFSAKYWTGHQYFIHKLDLYCALASKKKSIPDWHLFITGMEMKWTKRYAMKSHVIAYQSLELLFGTHTFHFNCFFEDFNCVFTQIRCLSRGLINISRVNIHSKTGFYIYTATDMSYLYGMFEYNQ